MSALKITNHRRRSHSTSDSPTNRSDNSWRTATKRARPHNPLSPGAHPDFSPHQKRDVDVWRIGKRARRDPSPSSNSVDAERSYISSSPGGPLSASAPSTPVFPSTAAEFNLFPSHEKNRNGPLLSSQPPSNGSTFAHSTDVDLLAESDLTRLHSDAFGELQRCVAENGESLVRRMRDYEEARSRSSSYTVQRSKNVHHGRGRKRASQRKSTDIGHKEVSDEDDEDDIRIFLGELRGLDGGPRKKRALSLGVIDIHNEDTPMSFPGGSEPCSSPGVNCEIASISSPYPSDDEGFSHRNIDSKLSLPFSNLASTPALSQTYSTSANSSLVSLPLPPHSLPVSPLFSYNVRNSLSLPASKSEKAIAALSLAMANGAGGLNDYEALHSHQFSQALLEDNHVGELWH